MVTGIAPTGGDVPGPAFRGESALAQESISTPPTGTSTREIELKLHAEPRHMARLAGHPLLLGMALGPQVVRRQTTTYYDTSDLRLADRGVALRVRQEDDDRVSQTVKTLNCVAAGDTAAIAVRREWDWPLTSELPNLDVLRTGDVAHLIPPEALPELRAIFATEIRRTTIMASPSPQSIIEVAFDVGVVRAGDHVHEVSESELELRSGTVGPLFDLALLLQEIVPLRIASESKAEAGYRLVTGRPPAPDQSEPAALSPATTVAESFRHVIRHCLRQLLQNEDCALTALAEPGGGDGRAIRFMRYALRRLRYGLELFEPVIASPESTAFASLGRKLARRLEPARDWSMIGPLLRLSGASLALGAIVPGTDSAAAREAAVLASKAIRAADFTTLVLRCGAWLEQDRWCEGADEALRRQLARPVADVVGPWLDQVYKRVRKPGYESGHPGELKRLRRRLRRLHDAADGFRSLFSLSSTRAFLAALVELRTVVDEIQDLRNGSELLRAAGVRLESAQVGLLERRCQDRLTELPETWRRFRDAEPFWRRGG